jgi:predicted lipid-binding transport protein (Tim44 family)
MSSYQARPIRSLKIFALAAALALAPALAQAKMGGGMSSGSRGSRTFSPPPATNTAPRPAAPIERTITPPPSAGPSRESPGLGANTARPAAPGGLFGGGFGRGLMGGLAGGLLGAGLFGLLTGQGFLGGMGGFMSVIGLLLQIALIVFLAKLAFNWFRSRNVASAGAAGPRPGAGAAFAAGPGSSGAGGLGFGFAGAQTRPQSAPLRLANEDFPAFERLLGETQAAYSREDAARLRAMTTPEMASYFEDELAANARKGVVNRISGVKLLQGDLSEAWREGSDEYATVAMRFALTDVMEDKASGKVVSGNPGEPTQSTEIWTFRRPSGTGPDAWKLSAIQQTA